MPRASIHQRFNTLIFAPVFTFLLYHALIWCEIDYQIVMQNSLVFILAFLYGTFFFSPDLDIAYMNKLWSWKTLFNFPFIPYALLFRHRGISHCPFWGLLSRIIYLLLLLILGIYLYFLLTTFWSSGLMRSDLSKEAEKTVFFIGFWGKEFQQFIWQHRLPCISLFCGFLLSDFSHLMLDKIGGLWPFKR